jgi:hypothetical protein
MLDKYVELKGDIGVEYELQEEVPVSKLNIKVVNYIVEKTDAFEEM